MKLKGKECLTCVLWYQILLWVSGDHLTSNKKIIFFGKKENRYQARKTNNTMVKFKTMKENGKDHNYTLN